SISHRSLMLGAIAQGTTQIKGLLLGEDPRRTAACFRAMGAKISDLEAEWVTVEGTGGELQEPDDVLNAGNSGTTLRLMLGLLASQPGKFFAVTGDDSLRSRPMKRVIAPLTSMGATIAGKANHTLAPLGVTGQSLRPFHYRSPIASAQVKSCLLLAGLTTNGDTTVTEPSLSRDHSERMLKAFGANLSIDPATHSVTLHGPAKLTGQTVIVPGDISSAAFWLVAAAITPGSNLLIENVGINPTRTGVLDALAAMNADITLENERDVTGEPVADLRVKHSQLIGCRIGGDLIPRLIDEVPALAVAALFATGITTITDAAELRVKESDRLAVMANALNQMAPGSITEQPEGMEIKGTGADTQLTAATLDSYTDHRIAMALTIAATRAHGQTAIQRADAAAVSYPTFVSTLETAVASDE
ncbi:3-phosphoshikimate 1-carboxyvinyltransferase, partial [cf. Phormidesmis sp. LEGE 11477]|uniref:3-phosphoshikimate 1-carboxyvinyltransferase n=1 Tax=cf. Phormidesmis sp. LEGE 11477 TaxID=1828680 RepID=UPI001D14EBBE